MGRFTHTIAAHDAAVAALVPKGGRATTRGEEKVRQTGKLDRLVDPAEYGVVRPSRIRLDERPDGLFEVTVGTPVAFEYRLDTTGSMGDNVDRALKALPETCGLTSAVLPGRDPFYCASIFGDLEDRFPNGSAGFPLCRGQFEAEAEKMVNQLTLMNPMRQGCGNGGEDPHYGLFGAAYLTNAYIRRIGLKSYDFTVTDEPMHEQVFEDQLIRIYGKDVLGKANENGHEINAKELPTNKEIVKALLKQAHAFALLVKTDHNSDLHRHWVRFFGEEHVVILPDIDYVPHVMATIIGLTEGTLDLQSAGEFLTSKNLTKSDAKKTVAVVSHIPLGAQCALPNFGRMPKKGDLFAKKTDLWPVDVSRVKDKPGKPETPEPLEGEGWL